MAKSVQSKKVLAFGQESAGFARRKKAPRPGAYKHFRAAFKFPMEKQRGVRYNTHIRPEESTENQAVKKGGNYCEIDNAFGF